MFWKNRRKSGSGKTEVSYDRSTQKPAIRCSICTGEQVAGFHNLADGSFEEVCLIESEDDLHQFRKQYGITEEIEKFY